MTILGQHTVAETRDLIRASNFRVNKNLQQLQRVQSFRLRPPTAENFEKQQRLDADMTAFVKKWTDVRDKETLFMLASMMANPALAPFVMPAESSYKAIDGAFRVDIPHFKDIEQRIDAEARLLGLPATDLSGIPPQNSPDADFAALQKLDGAIAAAGNPLGKPGGTDSVASSPLGLLLIGGAVVVGIGGILYVKAIL